MSHTKNPAGDTPVDRLAKFAVEWPKSSHRSDDIQGLNVGHETRHAELCMSDILAVLSDRADLLAALIALRSATPGTATQKAARRQADAAIAKANGS
jgi:hypothetical protein